MKRSALFVVVVLWLSLISQAAPSRVKIQVDYSEADAVLTILDKLSANQTVTPEDWQKLFDSRPYQRLKQRETAFGGSFTDESFRKFVESGEASGRGAELRRTIEAWRRVDFDRVAARILPYLPAQARINATVYPVIKPLHNSFVWDMETDPAIFLYINAKVTGPQFENTVAHELHHIGLNSVEKENEAAIAGLPENAQLAARWTGAFGEGFAMLAAAGSPDVHPHAISAVQDRERWDRDSANFDSDLRKVDSFFLDVLHGKLSKDAVRNRAMAFFGEQGPWYTVGYRMASELERRYGRSALLRCMTDTRKLLATWNEIAATMPGPKPATWSTELIKGVAAEPVR